MSVTAADTLDSRLRKRSSSSRRTSRVSSISSGINRRLSRTSSKSVTADNPVFANKDDLFNEQDVLCSRFLSAQDINHAGVPTGCSPPDTLKQPSRHGVRLRFLQRIRDQLRQLPTEDGHVWSCTTVYKLLKTFTASQQCSFTSLLQQYGTDNQHPFTGGNTNDVSSAANVYVAQAWEIPFNVLVDSLESFIKNNNKDHNTKYFYVSGFSLNLHAELDKEEYMNGLWTCIGNYQDVVFVVDRWLNPVSFTRLWCLWELVAGIESQTTNVTLQLSKSESESFRAELSNGIEVIWDSFFSVNAETAITSSQDDTKLINNHIKESISKEKVGMNQRIMKLLRGWLVDVCRAELEQSRLQDAQSDRTVRLMNNLGVLLFRESKLKEVEALYRAGLQIREDTLDANHPDIATSCGLLGTLTFELAKFKESEQLLRRALAIRENPSSGCSELDIAQSCNDLGELLTKLTKFDEAEGLLQRALGIRETKLGDKHIKVAQSCNSIGILLEWRHKHEESMEMHHRALAICEELLYPNHLDIAKSCSRMAVELWRMQLGSNAKKVLSRALQIFQQLLDDNHFLIGYCFSVIGSAYRVLKNLKDAELCYKQALDIQLKTLGENHPSVATLYCCVSLTFGNDRLDEKLEWSMRSLQGCITAYGEYHMNVSIVLQNIAIIYRDWDQLENAEHYFREAVRVNIECLGEYDESTLNILRNLVGFLRYYQHAKWKDALDVYRQIVRITLKINGVDHKITIKYLNSLMQIATKRVSCQEIEPYARLLVKASVGLNGKNHIKTAKYYSKLAVILEKQEKFEEAQQMYQKAVECHQGLDKPNHNDQLKVVEMLMKREKWEKAESMIRKCLLDEKYVHLEPQPNFTIAELLRLHGTILEHQDKLIDAKVAYEESCKSYPLHSTKGVVQRSVASLRYSKVLIRLGDLRKARTWLSRFPEYLLSAELSNEYYELLRWIETVSDIDTVIAGDA